MPALALLKIVCWQNRHYISPRKDAYALSVILANYLAAGNESRLWSEFVHWTQQEDFDYECAVARLLGHDMRALLDDDGVGRVVGILREQTDRSVPARLPTEMNPYDPDRALALLRATLGEMTEGSRR